MMKKLLKSLPYISTLHQEIANLKLELTRWKAWKPPGHYYSPIPAINDINKYSDRIFVSDLLEPSGVEINHKGQLNLLHEISKYYLDLPNAWKTPGEARYNYTNEYYSYADAIVLFCMIRHLSPKRIIEVGSGYSSAAILDTNDLFFDSKIMTTFIDPYPDRLFSLISEGDRHRTVILAETVQNIPSSIFQDLQQNDILFIDSSHVSKTGSDLNHLLFNILPSLNDGVWIHFHDIFYPFEYPKSWAEAGIAWNEIYLLRAFLQFNHTYQIQLFISFLLQNHINEIVKLMPLALKGEKAALTIHDAPGSGLWLRKTQ